MKKAAEQKQPEPSKRNQTLQEPPGIRVRPVVNALSILRHLGQKGGPDNVSGIARATGLHLSNCFNILKTLTFEGLITFDPATKAYALGFGLVQLAQSVLTQSGRSELIRPLLQQVAQRFSVTVTLWKIESASRSLIVSVTPGTDAIEIHMPVGQRVDLLNGAFGRVYAFHTGISRSRLRVQLEAIPFAREPAFATYWKEVQAVGELGWAADDESYAIGVASIAVPILDSSSALTHGLTATMFKGQLDRKQHGELATSLLKLAPDIATLLH